MALRLTLVAHIEHTLEQHIRELEDKIKDIKVALCFLIAVQISFMLSCPGLKCWVLMHVEADTGRFAVFSTPFFQRLLLLQRTIRSAYETRTQTHANVQVDAAESKRKLLICKDAEREKETLQESVDTLQLELENLRAAASAAGKSSDAEQNEHVAGNERGI